MLAYPASVAQAKLWTVGALARGSQRTVLICYQRHCTASPARKSLYVTR